MFLFRTEARFAYRLYWKAKHQSFEPELIAKHLKIRVRAFWRFIRSPVNADRFVYARYNSVLLCILAFHVPYLLLMALVIERDSKQMPIGLVCCFVGMFCSAIAWSMRGEKAGVEIP